MTKKTMKEWMEGKEDKPIETIEDAIMVIAAHEYCSGMSCSGCAMHMFDHSDSRCHETIKIATKKMIELSCKGNSSYKPSMKGKNAQQVIYESLYADKRDDKADKDKSGGICADCVNSKMHSSGILWCDSFHNFVHEDGFCYRFVDAKLEEEVDKLLVDNSDF